MADEAANREYLFDGDPVLGALVIVRHDHVYAAILVGKLPGEQAMVSMRTEASDPRDPTYARLERAFEGDEDEARRLVVEALGREHPGD